MEERSPAGGYFIGHRHDGDCVAKSIVRVAAVADGLPERVEATGPLLMFNSCAAAVGKRPELVVRSIRRVKIAKQVEPPRCMTPGERDSGIPL